MLLLDISDNEEYIWTTAFDPSFIPLPPSPSPLSSPSLDVKSSNITPEVTVGAIVGSLIVGILLSLGGFFLYKWSKDKRNRNNATLVPYNSDNSERVLNSSPENENTTNNNVINQ